MGNDPPDAGIPSGTPDPDRDWSQEYYRTSLEAIRDFTFTRFVFHSKPALVARHAKDGWRKWQEYQGQSYDPDVYELRENAWDHQHCYVCTDDINPGMSYWENSEEGRTVCDVCHAYIVTTWRSIVEGRLP